MRIRAYCNSLYQLFSVYIKANKFSNPQTISLSSRTEYFFHCIYDWLIKTQIIYGGQLTEDFDLSIGEGGNTTTTIGGFS
jgi:hypothetical protein